MNAQEQLKLDIIAKVSTGKMTRKEAQRILGVSERTLRRALRSYVSKGPLFVKHGNCKKAPSNRIDPLLKKRVQYLVTERYFDFNLTHLLEKLSKEQEIHLRYDTLRRWCHEIGMVKRAKKRRSPKIRRRRDRMAQTGIMLQMDGSPHTWFGGKQSCLIGAIDDADGEVPFAEFFPSEDTLSCMRVMQKIIEKKGIFQILYVDKAGIFGGQKRANFSQFKRAVEELGIHVIFAQSPEAKGRIERLWGTLQDRLIPEMRLRGIRSYENANRFLQEQFLPLEYSSQFKVVPENLTPGYRPLPENIDLNEVFCIKEERTCARDHTFSWNGQTYLIESNLKHSIYKQKIEIRTYQNLTWRVFFAGKELEVRAVKEAQKSSIDSKVHELHGIQVRCDGHIQHQGRYYSLGEAYIGQVVSVTESAGRVVISRAGQILESYPKMTLPEQKATTRPEHLSPWRKAIEATSSFRRNARVYGPFVEEFVLAVLKQGHGVIDTGTIYGVLNLDKTYPAKSINDACQLALELEQYSYRAVKILLRLQPTRLQQKQANAKTQPLRLSLKSG